MKIIFKKNGPALIPFDKKLNIKIKGDNEEKEMETGNIALCRCGASKNKPFCDGSHKEINFEADEKEIEVPM